MNPRITREEPFPADAGQEFSWLRSRLRECGFTEGAVSQVLEGRGERLVDVACALRRTEESSSVNVLIRLYVLGVEVGADEVGDALTPDGCDVLCEAGILRRGQGCFKADARLIPWGDFLLLSDRLPPEGQEFPHDYVMSGVSSSSLMLNRLTPRQSVGRALDIGTGAGVHALLAARHAEEVVATDTNPRALSFARMSARLNGIENISFRLGSFFEPVQGEKFDLIVSNPPFLISPSAELMFQNPGTVADGVSELMIREMPGFLTEGGQGVSMASWIHHSKDDWSKRPAEWVAARGVDIWLLHATSVDPITYAAQALRQTESVHSDRYSRLLDEWVAYLRDGEMDQLAMGVACLRRRTARKNWVHCVDQSGTAIATDAWRQLQRIFAAEDLLSGMSDDELLEVRVSLHPDHILEQELVPAEDGWASRSIILKPLHGIEGGGALDSRVLFLLTRCAGSPVIRDLLAEVAERDGADFAMTAANGLPLIRRLLRAGVLVPAHNSPEADAPSIPPLES